MTNKKNVVLIALHPDAVDYGRWPGLDADQLRRQLEEQKHALEEEGVDAALCLVDSARTASEAVTEALDRRPYDCVVIDAGLRADDERFPLFEKVVNLVHEHAPTANICFNTGPEDTVNAAQRWL
ncbi:MAG: hypothetical protein TEF_04865 [Rhizobiales bacterium NRL2]|jgi:hypothetical protein|nr:MAG: hypothetical protein TEF_04865 [Rhizobiales bacterium NRL2]